MGASEDSAQRHSRAAEAELIKDPHLKAEAEALNGLRQYDLAMRMVNDALDRGSFKLRLSHILSLHREALAGISSFAGNFRPAGVSIDGSKHEPVGAHLVPELAETLCDYVNENWADRTALHLAAYAMWRLNWIHPFADGNGRTSRILSYLILCIRTGWILPGTPTIPDQIVQNRTPYFEALDAADAAWRNGTMNVSKMEALLEGLLATQLMSVYHLAGGSAES